MRRATYWKRSPPWLSLRHVSRVSIGAGTRAIPSRGRLPEGLASSMLVGLVRILGFTLRGFSFGEECFDLRFIARQILSIKRRPVRSGGSTRLTGSAARTNLFHRLRSDHRLRVGPLSPTCDASHSRVPPRLSWRCPIAHRPESTRPSTRRHARWPRLAVLPRRAQAFHHPGE